MTRRTVLAAAVVALTLGGCAGRGQAAPAERAALDYRIAVARHLYEQHLDHVHDGKLPPLLHAVAAIRTTVDAGGRVPRPPVSRRPGVAPPGSVGGRPRGHSPRPTPAGASRASGPRAGRLPHPRCRRGSSA